MRVIGGKLRGKNISFIKNLNTRPLKDSVKENIFNILQHSNLINIDILNSNVLDLYSGFGSFGIEAISRGASKVIFIDKDNAAQRTLKKEEASGEAPTTKRANCARARLLLGLHGLHGLLHSLHGGGLLGGLLCLLHGLLHRLHGRGLLHGLLHGGHCWMEGRGSFEDNTHRESWKTLRVNS